MPSTLLAFSRRQYCVSEHHAAFDDDSESTIFTMLARGVEQTMPPIYDRRFLERQQPDLAGTGNMKLPDKLTFSDGAGQDVMPTVDSGFPTVAGKTDFAALLENGPVMIGGPASQNTATMAASPPVSRRTARTSFSTIRRPVGWLPASASATKLPVLALVHTDNAADRFGPRIE